MKPVGSHHRSSPAAAEGRETAVVPEESASVVEKVNRVPHSVAAGIFVKDIGLGRSLPAGRNRRHRHARHNARAAAWTSDCFASPRVAGWKCVLTKWGWRSTYSRDGPCAVGRAIVTDDDLEVEVAARDQAFEALPNVPLLVVRDDAHGNFRGDEVIARREREFMQASMKHGSASRTGGWTSCTPPPGRAEQYADETGRDGEPADIPTGAVSQECRDQDGQDHDSGDVLGQPTQMYPLEEPVVNQRQPRDEWQQVGEKPGPASADHAETLHREEQQGHEYQYENEVRSDAKRVAAGTWIR